MRLSTFSALRCDLEHLPFFLSSFPFSRLQSFLFLNFSFSRSHHFFSFISCQIFNRFFFFTSLLTPHSFCIISLSLDSTLSFLHLHFSRPRPFLCLHLLSLDFTFLFLHLPFFRQYLFFPLISRYQLSLFKPSTFSFSSSPLSRLHSFLSSPFLSSSMLSYLSSTFLEAWNLSLLSCNFSRLQISFPSSPFL
jgi:hypothetical protein